MHQHHASVWIVVLVVGGTFAFTAGIALIALLGRRRLFAGTARDQWEEARRGLTRSERFRVQKATMQGQPVPASELIPAQRAFMSYAQDISERSPWATRRWVRILFPGVYGLLAVSYGVQGFQESRLRVFHFALAVLFAGLGVLWGTAMPVSLRRAAERRERVRARLEERCGPESPAL